MKVKVLHKFHDKADYNKVYLVGETVTFNDTRAEFLIGLGLVEKDEAIPAVTEKVEKPTAPRKRKTSKEQ